MKVSGLRRQASYWLLPTLLLCSSWAWGFGARGHRLIAELAQLQLKPAAAAQLRELLGAQTLAQAATWADEIRDGRRETAPWHYMNFGDDCRYQPGRDCPRGNCLVPVLQQQIELLRDRRNSREARAEALRFVVHLLGDLHQPLHLGHARDRGGNDYQVAFDRRPAASPPTAADDDAQARARQRWWNNRTQGYNLHSLWDTQLLESTALREAAYLQQLQALPATPAAQRRLSVVRIAEQSCALVRQPDFYPPQHRINHAYVQAQRPVLERQLRLAGDRLAELLNRVLQ